MSHCVKKLEWHTLTDDNESNSVLITYFGQSMTEQMMSVLKHLLYHKELEQLEVKDNQLVLALSNFFGLIGLI